MIGVGGGRSRRRKHKRSEDILSEFLRTVDRDIEAARIKEESDVLLDAQRSTRAVSDETSISDGQWSCIICTYINVPSMKTCSMCQQPRVDNEQHTGSIMAKEVVRDIEVSSMDSPSHLCMQLLYSKRVHFFLRPN